jgi:hypothetical protein
MLGFVLQLAKDLSIGNLVGRPAEGILPSNLPLQLCGSLGQHRGDSFTDDFIVAIEQRQQCQNSL